MIAKIKCWFLGHKRGKRVPFVDSTGTVNVVWYQCPRCAARWCRKGKD